MFKRTVGFCALIVLVVVAHGFAEEPTEIWYEVADLGAGRWEYTYDVTNNSLTEGIDEFTIWFDYGLYDDLMVTTPATPADWDQIVWQPEPVLEDDGAYDALATNSGIGIDITVGDLSVSFDWLGTGDPGSQFYEIVVPNTSPMQVIDSGWTVPEPTALLLITFGVIIVRRERNIRN